jgi:hypothetical protein
VLGTAAKKRKIDPKILNYKLLKIACIVVLNFVYVCKNRPFVVFRPIVFKDSRELEKLAIVSCVCERERESNTI